MNNWDSSLIEKIFSEKEQEKSEDRDNLLRLTSQRLYGEKIHYVLELIQNAEDETSSSIIFMFNKDNIAIVNDGKPFDDEDVWGICSVRPGKKKNKIGFFGIGFKSVFNITKKPQIISNNFNFEIENYIYPKPKTSIPEYLKKHYSAQRGSIFILPYYPELSISEILIENFSSLDEKILLFLKNLKELKLIDNINKVSWEIKKDLEKNSIISLFNTRNEEKTKWRVFHHDLPVDNEKIVPEGKEGIKETRITVAFPIDNLTREEIKKNGVVYCYLPTKKRTDLPFLIQADFLPTIGRENISDHPWNVWLLKELGTLAAKAIDEIKNDEQLCDFLYDFIPLSEEIQDDLIKCLYTSLFETLKEKEIAKTNSGWSKPKICVIPEDDRLRHILSETDLKLLFNERLFYLDQNLCGKDHFTRAENVLFELGAKKIGPEEVVDFIQKENNIESRDGKWFLNLYDYLRTVFDINKKSYWEENIKALYEKLEKAKFILTHEKNLLSLKDPQMPDRLICYPQNINLSEVHKLFTEGEIVFLHRYFQESGIARRKEGDAETEEKRKLVKEWFDDIGVKKYFKQAHIIKEVILPKFTSGKYKEYDDLKLYRLVDYIRNYWSTIESEIKNKKLSSDIVEAVKSSVMIKAFSFKDGNKINDYRSPGEIYFSNKYGKNEVMEDLFERIENIYFLSPYYLNREKREKRKKKRGRQKIEYSLKKFFEILGVWSSPIVNKDYNEIEIGWSSSQFKWVERENSNWGHQILGDCKSPDIEKLIEFCSRSDNKDENQRKMKLLWESLSENWELYKDRYCSCEYKWHEPYSRYSSSKTLTTSSFLEFLKGAKWILGKDCGFYKPSEVFNDTKKNRLLLEKDVKYTNLKATKTFLKDLEIRIEPEIGEVVTHTVKFSKENPQPKDNKIGKMEVVYCFIRDKIKEIEDTEERENKIKDIKNEFVEYGLLYLPRVDRSWWNPGHVFWGDFSNKFETLRGYIENNGKLFYDISLKDFLISIGVIEKPSLKECFDLLEELKAENDVGRFKRFAPKIYMCIDDIKKHDNIAKTSEKQIFLSERGIFLSPTSPNLYFSDNDEYRQYFGDNVEILWLPFSWINAKHMLQSLGFKRLGQHISISKNFSDLKEVEGDITYQLIKKLLLVGNFLRKKDIGLFEELKEMGVFQNIGNLRAFETQQVILDFSLKVTDTESITVENMKKDAYFSVDENRIYKRSQIDLFSIQVAKELSKIFAPGEDTVLVFLDSIFAAHSEEELLDKLRHFGIDIHDIPIEGQSEKVIVIEQNGKTIEEEPENEGEEDAKPIEKIPKKPKLPEPEPQEKKFGLIDPNEFVFDTFEECTPYKKADGSPNVPTKTIKLREGYPSGVRVEVKPRKRVNRNDAEGVALEIAMRFEETEGREPDDRHGQHRIGYDIYSKVEGKEERFIEVKHFGEEAGTWELQPYQSEKAEKEGEKYFVYVVSRLKEGNIPVLEIIQDPINYLIPDPPVQKKFSNWKNAVINVIRCQKI